MRDTPRPRGERFLEHHDVRQPFRGVVGSQTTRRMKPQPEPPARSRSAEAACPAQGLLSISFTSAHKTRLTGVATPSAWPRRTT